MACKTTKATEEKKCCYMERVCNADCVAYLDNGNANEMGMHLGMPNIACLRLLIEAANLLNAAKNADDEDWDDEDEDWDDEDEDKDEDEEVT
ncbi:hypothetical protein KKE26_01270 [bacterium]|nr:hypothetical protein [bacterium]MBU1752531.1 hypothetical protein [bacterium]